MSKTLKVGDKVKFRYGNDSYSWNYDFKEVLMEVVSIDKGNPTGLSSGLVKCLDASFSFQERYCKIGDNIRVGSLDPDHYIMCNKRSRHYPSWW